MHHGVRKHAVDYIGADQFNRHTVDTLEGIDAGRGLHFHKIAQRHHALAGTDAQFVHGPDTAITTRVTHPDIHRVHRPVGPVFPHLDAVGHQLHGDTGGGNIRAVNGRLGPVDIDAPLYRRQRCGVVDIHQFRQGVEIGAHPRHSGFQQTPVARGQLDLYRLAHRRALLFRQYFNPYAGQVCGALTDLAHNGVAGHLPFRLREEFQVDRADNIGTAAGATATTTATRQHGLGVDEAYARNLQDFALGFKHQFIDFTGGKISAAKYRDLEELGFCVGKKYRAHPELAVGPENGKQQTADYRQRPERSRAHPGEKARVLPGGRLQQGGIARLQQVHHLRNLTPVGRRPAEQRAQHRAE